MQRDHYYRFVDRELVSRECSPETPVEWADGARWILILSAVGWLALIGIAAIL